MSEGIGLGKCIADGSSPLGEIVRIALSFDGSVLAAVVGTSIQVRCSGRSVYTALLSFLSAQGFKNSVCAVVVYSNL